MEKQPFQSSLQEARRLIDNLGVLIADVTLLSVLNKMLLDIAEAVDTLLAELECYQGDQLVGYLLTLDAVSYLDEVVDLDPVSQLEVRFFGVLDSAEEGELTLFLMQVLDKIESAHAQLIEKIHEFNALLEA